jgi:hypothetical protein
MLLDGDVLFELYDIVIAMQQPNDVFKVHIIMIVNYTRKQYESK